MALLFLYLPVSLLPLSPFHPFPFSLVWLPYTFFFHNGISRSLISQVNLSISTSALHPQHSNNYLFTCNYQMEKLEIIPKNDTKVTGYCSYYLAHLSLPLHSPPSPLPFTAIVHSHPLPTYVRTYLYLSLPSTLSSN